MKVEPNLSFKLLPFLPLMQAAYVSLETTNSTVATSDISWGPCSQEFETIKSYVTTIDCGNLTVPLDYHDSSKGTIELNLLRAHAPVGPARGSVLINYGGPGEVGRSNLAQNLPWAFTITGFVHDLVIFDPRGTVDTIPMACYNSTESTGSSQFNSNASDTAIGEIWTGAENLADACYTRNGTIGSYIGTAAVARDLMSVVDALKEDGFLRYYGVSYGTVLGATVAAMFPDRIDRMYLDGVVNSHEYYHSLELEWLSSTDDLWSDFFVGCAAAPSACPLAREGKSAKQLEDDYYGWLYHLKQEPLSLGITAMLTYTKIKSFLFGYTYQPTSWHNISGIIDAAQRGSATLALERFAAIESNVLASADLPVGSNTGIKCSDKIPRTETLDAWRPQAEKLQGMSKAFGDVQVQSHTQCARWKMSAVEIYQGDFKVKTKQPILFGSNEFDPVTPLVSARNMSAGFEGSFLLVNKNGHGHSTRKQPSACILNNVSSYFLTGNLPAAGTICEPSAPLFGNVTEAQVLAMVNGNK